MKPSLNPTVNQFQFAQLLAYFIFYFFNAVTIHPVTRADS